MSSPIWQARIDLAAAYRLADRFGLNEGINNHFTARVPDQEDRFLVVAHGLHWSEVKASSLLVADSEGHVHEGDGEVEPSALFIHSAILAARPDASCVLHTHQTYATTLTTFEEGRLLPISQNALRFHGRVAYDDTYQGAADHAAEGERLAARLGDKAVLFHASHGVVVVGETIARGFDDLYFLERACQVQVLAQSTGKSLRDIADSIAAAYVRDDRANNLRKQAREHFAALKRVLARESPDFAQ